MSTTQTELPLTIPAAQPPLPAAPASPWFPGARRRGLPRLKWPVLAIVAVLAVLGLGGYSGLKRLLSKAPAAEIQVFKVLPRTFPVTLDEKGELKAEHLIEVRCELEGKSTIIWVAQEGAHVKKSEPLVELASDVIDTNIRDQEIKEATAQANYEAAVKDLEILRDKNASDIRKADWELQKAQLDLDKYKSGDAIKLRQEATLELEKTRNILERSKEDLKDAQQLFDQDFLTRNELEGYKFKAYEADLNVRNAELALKVLEKYTIPMDTQQKQSTLTEAAKELDRTRKSAASTEAKSAADVASKRATLDLERAKLAKLRDQKAKAKISAPADGLVVYHNESWHRQENTIEKGTQVIERQCLIELPDTSSMKVVIRVHEAQTEYLKVGLPATIEIEGISGRQFTGKVSKIAVLADSQNRWLNPNLKEYETEVLLDGTFTELKPGVTAHVKIELARLNDVLAVPVQCVFAKGGKYFVFRQRGGKFEPAPVQLGLSSNEYAEVKSGLQAGDTVHMAVTEEMKLMLPEEEKSSKADKKPAKPAKPIKATSRPRT